MTEATENIPRRLMLKTLWAGVWAALVTALAVAVAAVLRFAGAGQGGPSAPAQVELAGADGLADGQVLTKGRVALVRDAAGLYALDLTCPHLGCRPAWQPKHNRFLCPCHGSVFARDGARISGPAQTGLKHIALERVSGAVVALPGRPVEAGARLKPGKAA